MTALTHNKLPKHRMLNPNAEWNCYCYYCWTDFNCLSLSLSLSITICFSKSLTLFLYLCVCVHVCWSLIDEQTNRKQFKMANDFLMFLFFVCFWSTNYLNCLTFLNTENSNIFFVTVHKCCYCILNISVVCTCHWYSL